MRLRGKPVNEITEEDILYLRDAEVPESRVLDYKLQLPDDNKELLVDITSFANTDGGVIVYGIEEKREDGKNTGIPGEIKGLENNISIDLVRQRVENVLRDNVEPRLSFVMIHQVEVQGKRILIVGIPRSLFAPHMVKKDSKFYARNDAGKFPMDVYQIRQAFLQTSDWEKEAENFRRTRIMEYLSGRNRYLEKSKSAVFLHIVPLGTNRQILDFRNKFQQLTMLFQPEGYPSWGYSHNLEGFLIWPGKPGLSYSQIFRQGALEVATSTLYYHVNAQNPNVLSGTNLEFYVVRSLIKYRTFAQQYEVQFPVAVFLSILGAHCPITGEKVGGLIPERILPVNGLLDYDEILLPGVIIDTEDKDIPVLMKGTFDMLWQAAGLEGSPHYKNDDSWGLSLG